MKIIHIGDVSIVLDNNGRCVDDRYYTVKEVAAYFRVSRKAVYEWINTGKIKAYNLMGCRRIKGYDLNSYIERNIILSDEDVVLSL